MPAEDVVEDSEPEREQRRRRRDEDQSDTVLQLSHFAYKTAQPSPRTPDPGPFRPTASIANKHPPDHLSDALLVQLSKCVSCGLEWTRKKTVNQKRTHIRQCAKKHALTKDTTRILVEKETAISTSAESVNETTLMDLVVPPGPVTGKAKRRQVLPTIMSLGETRDSILSRAKDVLESTSNQAVPQSTQHFGESALACRNIRPALHGADRSTEEPPSTQPFRASSLCGGGRQPADGYEQPRLQVGASASLFAQEAALSNDRHKRPVSPLSLADNPRTVRRRLVQ